METSSVDNELLVLLSKNLFPMVTMSKIFASFIQRWCRPRMNSFSCKQILHTSSLGAKGFTFLTTSHLMLELTFLCFFLNFQRSSLSVVKVLLCSNLKDDLCKLILLLNSFSVSPIYFLGCSKLFLLLLLYIQRI